MTIPWRSPVVPVVTIERSADAVPLATALRSGGVDVIEIVMRTPAALEAVRAIRAEVESVCVGVGSVLNKQDVDRAVRAGAQFLVTPGSTDRLLDALEDSGLWFMPGTASPSDMIRLLERGITHAKLFPASAVGGIELLRSVAGPMPQLSFCPTGGITEDNASQLLALSNVTCVGGSWLTPTDAIAARDWPRIEMLARRAIRLSL